MKITANMKILVVEDDLDTRNLIKTLLRKQGFKNIHSVVDGVEGLDFLEKAFIEDSPVKLILADWNMPKLDGISFLNHLKNSIDFKGIPFVMVTADNDRQHVVEAINSGVSEYLIKPIKPEILVEKMVSAVKKAS
ncbi:hypothetical protein A9Q84_01805 [Halobacteriovorax marinus]|uniref:Response regulatory domain-containing protein n=1 Tax=Halobacteriovorax marinus TaxID=97084 RepID=A0A1Y5FIV6_9BACT|nr:hypothetical protein A9Q84_01805 [Halobacteriovorax marinus]